MSVKFTFEDDTLICRLQGEIDHHTALPIRLETDDRIESCRPAKTVMDFSEVTFMDSSGIGLVMGRYRLLSEMGGELEITDLNKMYLKQGQLNVVTLGRGYAWLDTGTVASLSDASDFVKAVETRAGIQIAALEDIAYMHGWITKDILEKSAEKYGKSPYGQYLKKVAEGRFRRDG